VAPAQVDPADVELATRLGALELSFVAAHQALLDRAILGPVEAQLVTTFAGHHLGHAAAFQTLLRTLDRTAPPLASDPDIDAELAALTAAATSRPALLDVAHQIEQMAAASATLATERAVGETTIVLVAEVAPVEAQHVLVLGTVLDAPIGERLADFETTTAHRLDG
jgi:hypothetical protein